MSFRRAARRNLYIGSRENCGVEIPPLRQTQGRNDKFPAKAGRANVFSSTNSLVLYNLPTKHRPAFARSKIVHRGPTQSLMSNPTPTPISKPIVIDAENIQPLDDIDKTLRESFAKDIAEQCNRLDDLAKQLITVQLAIPGIFATVLKAVAGDTAVLPVTIVVLLAYAAWFAGLLLTWASLMPKKNVVDRNSLTEINDYFAVNAKRKYDRLKCASISTFVGIVFAVLSIYIK